jgi:hypothetical protein
LVSSGIDKKSLFARHRPAQAEIMPETVWISDVMGKAWQTRGSKSIARWIEHSPAFNHTPRTLGTWSLNTGNRWA